MSEPLISPAARLKWACRRGMLELDLILLPFFETQFANLSLAEQGDFEALLGSFDQDLYAWLLNFQPCHEERYHPILLKIRTYVQHQYSA
jgi:antitoxin CptB